MNKRIAILTAFLSLGYLVWLPQPARSVSPNAITQITSGFNADAAAGSISGNGSLIAFRSAADLLGLNPDHTQEVFLINADGTGLRQLTSSDDASFSPRISADGSKVAFISRGDLVAGRNRDNSSELFVANTFGPGLLQLTRATNLDAQDPSISGNGALITFASNGNYTGQNPDRGFELFVINSDGTGLRQLTQERDARFGSFSGRISRDGSRIIFISTENLTGLNADHAVNLFTILPDGTGLRQLTFFGLATGTDLTLSCISDDGAKVVFDTDADPLGTNADRIAEIFSINTDGTGLMQVTNADGTDSFFPMLRGDGTEIVFTSVTDFTGGNPNNAIQIFRANANGTGIVQLTSDPGVSLSLALALSADGSRIAFTSNTNLLGFNLDLNNEAYVINRDGSGLAQLTNTIGYTYLRPVISGQGNRLIFDSRADLVGANPGHNRQVFIADADGANLRQLSNNIGPDIVGVGITNAAADITADGQLVAFISDADPLGTNPLHRRELFTIQADGSNIRQLTIGGVAHPAISRDGMFIAFDSNANFVGTNADHSRELFRVSASGFCQDGGPSTGCTQLTNSTGAQVLRPSISGDGSKVAFLSSQNIAGGNLDGNLEVFIVNGNGSGLRQLTNTVQLPDFLGIRRAHISADGTMIVFDGDVDPLGTNSEAVTEIFVIASDGTGLRQLTEGVGGFGSLNPTITGDGKTIAFQSNLNPRGRNRDESTEIFTISSRGTGLKQVTNSFPQSIQPWISDDGKRLGFLSSANLVGTNPDLFADVFVLVLKGPR